MKIITCGSRTCKPNSVCRIAPAGRSFLWAPHYCGAQATYPEVVTRRAGTIRASFSAQPGIPPYLVLLRVGFALPAALLRRRCALTAPFHPYPDVAARAVCFLWHFPSAGLEPGLPDVIRHTALRSSDFPPVIVPKDATSDRPVQLPTISLYAMRFPGSFFSWNVIPSVVEGPGVSLRVRPDFRRLPQLAEIAVCYTWIRRAGVHQRTN